MRVIKRHGLEGKIRRDIIIAPKESDEEVRGMLYKDRFGYYVAITQIGRERRNGKYYLESGDMLFDDGLEKMERFRVSLGDEDEL